jgi:ribosome-associated toxin RatA of RatAB toxin-antitoxin module
MKSVHKSVLIWYSAAEMYALVTAIADYPKFLPWCDHAEILSGEGDRVSAEIGILFGGIRQTFSTLNVHVPEQEVQMQLISGPFSKLDGTWRFQSLGTDQHRACAGLELWI